METAEKYKINKSIKYIDRFKILKFIGNCVFTEGSIPSFSVKNLDNSFITSYPCVTIFANYEGPFYIITTNELGMVCLFELRDHELVVRNNLLEGLRYPSDLVSKCDVSLIGKIISENEQRYSGISIPYWSKITRKKNPRRIKSFKTYDIICSGDNIMNPRKLNKFKKKIGVRTER